MDGGSRRKVCVKIIGPDRDVHFEATGQLAGDRMEEIAFSTSDTMAGRDVQYPNAHQRRQ